MAKFPRVPVTINHGWYLAPVGRDDPDTERKGPAPCDGSAAFCYLPAYNPAVRDGYVRKGFRLLSVCQGDMAEKNLVIGPPRDEVLQEAIFELGRRVEFEKARIAQELDHTTEMLDSPDMDSDERRLYRQRKRQLERQFKECGKGLPTVAEARLFFMREYQMRVNLGLPDEARKFAAAQRTSESVAAQVAAAQLAAHQEQMMTTDAPKSRKAEAVA